MPRARSGSFYCPLEDAAGPLSLSQKAAISTAHPQQHSTSLPSTSQVSRPLRRHIRTPSFDGAVSISAPTSVTLPPAKLQSDITLPIRSHSHFPKRHPWSPRQPSPLRHQVDAPAPMAPPSTLWTARSEPTLPIPCSQRKPRPLRQSVLKNSFLSSPMGEKASMYGLRVAWCVWGDVRDILAKEIYRSRCTATSSDEEPEHREHASVDRSDSLSPPPPMSSTIRRSGLRRENSFVWEEQAPIVLTPEELDSVEPLPIFDLDLDRLEPSQVMDEDEESTTSESDYSDDEEGDTESDELDLSDIELGLEDEEEVERDFVQALREKTVNVHEHWEVLSLRI